MSKPYQKELSRHPSQSVTWVRILENGDFEVEFYDYSCDADSSFNHDYAIKNSVKSGDVSHVRTLLCCLRAAWLHTVNFQNRIGEVAQMEKDKKTGLWLCGISLCAWFFGAGSFGVTGGNILTVIIANLGFLFGPFAFLFGIYLLVKS